MSEIMSKEANYSSADSSSSNKQKGRSILFLVRCFCSHKHTGAGKKWSPNSTWYLKCIFLNENNWVLIWFHLNLFPMVQLPIKITSENGSKLSNMQRAIAVTNHGPIYTLLTCQYRSQNLLDTAYIQPVTIYYQPSWSYFELFTNNTCTCFICGIAITNCICSRLDISAIFCDEVSVFWTEQNSCLDP